MGESETPQGSSLAHVIQKNKGQKNADYTLRISPELRQGKQVLGRRYYINCIKSGIHPVLCRASKRCASRFYQLKAGHGAVGVFSGKKGVAGTAQCWWCGEAELSFDHLSRKSAGNGGRKDGS